MRVPGPIRVSSSFSSAVNIGATSLPSRSASSRHGSNAGPRRTACRKSLGREWSAAWFAHPGEALCRTVPADDDGVAGVEPALRHGNEIIDAPDAGIVGQPVDETAELRRGGGRSELAQPV